MEPVTEFFLTACIEHNIVFLSSGEVEGYEHLDLSCAFAVRTKWVTRGVCSVLIIRNVIQTFPHKLSSLGVAGREKSHERRQRPPGEAGERVAPGRQVKAH